LDEGYLHKSAEWGGGISVALLQRGEQPFVEKGKGSDANAEVAKFIGREKKWSGLYCPQAIILFT
jgi:hypothetical protein